MELYGSGQSCQYIERFTTLLSKGLVCLSLRSAEARGRVIAIGGGWKTGDGVCRGMVGDNRRG